MVSPEAQDHGSFSSAPRPMVGPLPVDPVLMGAFTAEGGGEFGYGSQGSLVNADRIGLDTRKERTGGCDRQITLAWVLIHLAKSPLLVDCL